jgi:transposase
MFAVEVYAAVRHFVFIEGNSRREAARVFGLSRETVSKMCRFSLPPGYTRTKPVTKPKLGTLLPVIDAILEADRTAPVKQRHTAKRIFERLRDEHGYAGGTTVVKDYVRIARGRLRETFVPLAHPPGHAQVDFGEAVGEIGGVRRKIHFFCMDLPHSDAPFVKAYPAETTEAFLDGHVSAFAFFGGVPLSILYDNTTIAVAKICGDGKRERTRAFTELQSHYLFRDRFGRPGKGNDKGKVEGLVKYARSNFMTPIPQAASFDDLDAMLEERCRRRRDDRAGRHDETIGERLVADLAAFRDLSTPRRRPERLDTSRRSGSPPDRVPRLSDRPRQPPDRRIRHSMGRACRNVAGFRWWRSARRYGRHRPPRAAAASSAFRW